MNELTTPATDAGTDLSLSREQVSTTNLILQPGALDKLERFAVMMAKGNVTVPQHLRGNVGDCMAIAMQAAQWGMSPFVVAQKTHLVQGTLGYEAQLVGAVLQATGAIKEKALEDEYFGDWTKLLGKFVERESKTKKDAHGEASKYKVANWNPKDEEGLGIRIRGTLRGETKQRELEMLMTQALTRNSTLWTTNPKQQLYYLAEKLWARKYAPGAILGVYTVDELEESVPKNMGAAVVVENTKTEGLSQEDIDNWKAAAEKGTAAGKAFWSKQSNEWRKRAPPPLRDAMWEVAVEADKKRTVDNAPAATDGETKPAGAETKPAESETKPASDETRTAKQDADPDTGETSPPPGATTGPATAETADFVAEMERAEREGRQP